MVGTTISHYKVIEKIGQGGMGEVFRATDTNLSRDVAIKVLPEQFTEDLQRLARFEREAKLLASLNHPNIAAIYGLEDADGVRFLALELVEGETLAERVAKGPVPAEEALQVCRQIAEGVEAAHEKGVIHRDLKPANVKVTPEGKVKILDFGLAKAFEDEIPAADISQSPTLTEEMTRAGVIMGTPAYLSPEQARGKAVDKRADIFAFGAVLYELLTGKRAFEGETIAETLASILKGEPDWQALPQNTSTRIRELMADCLEKGLDDRLPDIGSARIQIKKALKEPASTLTVTRLGGAQPLWKRAIPWSIAALALVIAGVGFWSLAPSPSRPIRELAITPPATAPLINSGGIDISISPDGKRVVYRALMEDVSQLQLRSMDSSATQSIPGTEGAVGGAFFSPDGESIAFVVAGELKKASLQGGPSVTLCDASSVRGGSWGPDGIIVFSASSEVVDDGSDSGRQSLYRVSANGGEPERFAIPDSEKGELSYRYPEILPDGKSVLFTLMAVNGTRISLLSLDTGQQRVIIEEGREAHYLPTGHLVYEAAQTGVLMAVPFDLSTQVTGDAVPVLEGIRQHFWTASSVDYSVSREGTLIYIPSSGNAPRNLVWVNRDGIERPVGAEERNYATPRISPDGNQVAFTSIEVGQRQVWIYDLERDSFRRLTFEGLNGSPNWSPDGKWITHGSTKDGPQNTHRSPADGTGSAKVLNSSPQLQVSGSWLPDGSGVTYMEGGDTWVVPVKEDSQPRVLLKSGVGARFSPDGKWLVYIAQEEGRRQVFVSPYTDPNVKFLVSGEEGGLQPVWAPDGTEIFYRRGNEMMVIAVQIEPTFTSSKPRVLFEGDYFSSANSPNLQYYDIHPKTGEFLMIKSAQEQVQINVVLNWFEELKRLVPVD